MLLGFTPALYYRQNIMETDSEAWANWPDNISCIYRVSMGIYKYEHADNMSFQWWIWGDILCVGYLEQCLPLLTQYQAFSLYWPAQRRTHSSELDWKRGSRCGGDSDQERNPPLQLSKRTVWERENVCSNLTVFSTSHPPHQVND